MSYLAVRVVGWGVLTGLSLFAHQPEKSGSFVLHKFGKAIGKETYSIQEQKDRYTLVDHFLFTDRARGVPLETTFVAVKKGMRPVTYSAKGKSSRFSDMDNTLHVDDQGSVDISIRGTASKVTPSGPWFITDGYSPVVMQEQMMRWWFTHERPSSFKVLPANAAVEIRPAETLEVAGHRVHGYTVRGLIWGLECLWMDDSLNLVALVTIDAEFDHFEALREQYRDRLGVFISAAVRADLEALNRLSAAAREKRSPVLAIVGATLENSTGAAPVRDSVILVQDGVIRQVGRRPDVQIPEGAAVLDATGKFAIPGLWDMHAHYEQVEWGPIYLAAGVTSVRDCGNEFDFITPLHELLNRRNDPVIGPHLEMAGLIDGTGKLTLGAVIANTPEEARAWVAKYKAAGSKQIKIYSSVKPDVVKAITAAAHAQGMTVTGHIPEGMTASEGIEDGMDQINHFTYLLPSFTVLVPDSKAKDAQGEKQVPAFDSARAKALLALMKSHGTVLDPTLALFELMRHAGPMDALEPGVDHLPPQLKEQLDSPPSKESPEALALRREIMLGTVRTVHRAGIPIVAGTDQAVPGYSLHRELELYVEAGFTPEEALQSATIVAARAAGDESESGSVEPGKRADVLLLDADPMADIHNTRKVWKTVAAGAVYSPGPLWESVGFKP